MWLLERYKENLYLEASASTVGGKEVLYEVSVTAIALRAHVCSHWHWWHCLLTAMVPDKELLAKHVLDKYESWDQVMLGY